MLFYSYAELVIGLVAVFYFTSKIFSIIKYKTINEQVRDFA